MARAATKAAGRSGSADAGQSSRYGVPPARTVASASASARRRRAKATAEEIGREIDEILDRLGPAIAREHEKINALLARLRETRLAG
jgi:hypothetical protein